MAAAAAHAVAAMSLGYVLLGPIPMLLFAAGFAGGFALWLLVPATPPFSRIKVPFYLVLALFVAHKMEERLAGFFPALARLTGEEVPEVGVLSALLYAVAMAWLLVPLLVRRSSAFGYYLAWSFFTSMGIIELAHFRIPLVHRTTVWLLPRDGQRFCSGSGGVVGTAETVDSAGPQRLAWPSRSRSCTPWSW